MDKVILITGSSRGIGASTAIMAAEQGYKVCINYRSNTTAATAVVKQIEGMGGTAYAIQADVANETEVLQMFNKVDERFGGLDALVNNAAILEQQMRLEEMDVDRLKRVFNANVIGSFVCMREAVKRMSTRYGGSGGAIVNISSLAATLGSANEYVDYAASKAAIDTMTIGLAKEVAMDGIRVNSVRPGTIKTKIHAAGRIERVSPFIPMQRAGEVKEIASAILWLLSDEASYITGSLMDVSGGL